MSTGTESNVSRVVVNVYVDESPVFNAVAELRPNGELFTIGGMEEVFLPPVYYPDPGEMFARIEAELVLPEGWMPVEPECPGDLNGDGVVNLQDLAQLLAHYGLAWGATYADGDLDEDYDVDLADLATLLALYGTTC